MQVLTVLQAHELARETGRKFELTTPKGHTVLIDGSEYPRYDNGNEWHHEFSIDDIAEVITRCNITEVI